ncbi:MAG: D-alanyl-D-alanine carboxypeptidase, partial [Clostridia bacterium]|nr:D-alanyl-D-alanine carboxypeptidase [Clostridia bacterium]
GRNPDKPLPMASVTKVMTLLLTFEALYAGKFGLEDGHTISKNAAGMGGSQAFLGEGLQYTVADLLRTVIIASANDSAVALSELVSGSEEAFVARMNERATELNCTNTKFQNPHGLPVADHYSTARDIAVMSRELLKHEEFFKWSRVWLDELVHPDGRTTSLTNTNRLIRFYDGADGVKTGFTGDAMYCLSASAVRNGQRYIAVVLGAPNSNVRFAEIQKLLDYGFAQYASLTLAEKGQEAGTVKIRGGRKPEVKAVAADDLFALLARGSEDEVKAELTLPEEIRAPITENQVLGQWRFKLGEETIGEIDLIASEPVLKQSLWYVITRIFGEMVAVVGKE